jgi:hypothetical protein
VPDVCLEGDFSPSFYDGKCLPEGLADQLSQAELDEKTEKADGTHGSATGSATPSPAQEYQTAYEWAYQYGITTMDTYQKARIPDHLTRAEMAKMIAVYATKFLHRTPDTSKIACTQFSDRKEVNAELQGYLVQICQLGLMGMQANGVDVQSNFRPNETLTRAEAGTTLSRMLRGNRYA